MVLLSVERVAPASFGIAAELNPTVIIPTIFALPMDYMSEKFSVRFRDLDLKIPLRVIGGQTDRRSGQVLGVTMDWPFRRCVQCGIAILFIGVW